jgi:hypothetical protein
VFLFSELNTMFFFVLKNWMKEYLFLLIAYSHKFGCHWSLVVVRMNLILIRQTIYMIFLNVIDMYNIGFLCLIYIYFVFQRLVFCLHIMNDFKNQLIVLFVNI